MPESDTPATEEQQYADPDSAACKYCGGSVNRIVPEGTPYWSCEKHDRLNVNEVLGVEAGRIPEHQRVDP